MANSTYWHEENTPKKKKNVYLIIIFIVLVILGIFYYFGTKKEVDVIETRVSESNIVDELVKASGDNLPQVFDGEGVKTTSYVTYGKTKDELIAEILQYLTKNGWSIAFGKEIKSGDENNLGAIYLISASDGHSRRLMEITITTQGVGVHMVSIVHTDN